MFAVVDIRRLVARPGARAQVIVAAVAWVITRVLLYVIDAGTVHVRWQGKYVSDLSFLANQCAW
ncbi:MAG TPA: hypothetical protein VLW50_21775 [Streptosporangiaceae bacterium]|nr:hypothetical protein [Streptosporangiaceae bacterium]